MRYSNLPAHSAHQTGFSNAGVSDWSALPGELLDSITKRFTVNIDYLHFRAVCVPWKMATTAKPSHLPLQSPWVMGSFEDSDRCNFLCLSTNKVYKLQLPEALGKRCCGSSNGWMVLLDDEQEVTLLNPLTRDHLSLPSIKEFPTVLDLWLEEEGDINWEAVYASKNLHDCILEKIVLSASPNSDDAIALALVSERVAFCRPGDATWTTMDDFRGFFTDAVYNDGKFYVVDCTGALFTVEIGSIPRVTLVVPPLPGDSIQRYVVESGGNIFLLGRIRHLCDPEKLVSGATVAFEILMLDVKGPQAKWAEVHDFGGYSVFLGVNESFSFLPDHYHGFGEDCIYFTDDYCWRYRTDDGEADGCMHNDVGIFNVIDKSIKPLSSYGFIWPTPKWITPSLC